MKLEKCPKIIHQENQQIANFIRAPWEKDSLRPPTDQLLPLQTICTSDLLFFLEANGSKPISSNGSFTMRITMRRHITRIYVRNWRHFDGHRQTNSCRERVKLDGIFRWSVLDFDGDTLTGSAQLGIFFSEREGLLFNSIPYIYLTTGVWEAFSLGLMDGVCLEPEIARLKMIRTMKTRGFEEWFIYTGRP